MDIYHPVKTCSKCGIEKSVSEYYISKDKKDGLNCHCKSCIKQYRQNNKEKLKEQRKICYIKNSEKRKISDKEYYKNNKEKIKEKRQEYYKNNKEKISEYRQINSEKIKEYGVEYKKNKRKTDPLYKLSNNTRILIISSIKRRGFKKNTKTQDILGCSIQEFKEHLESQFDENMNWDNHGTYWDIDHIIPSSSANTEEDIIKLNHYTNLRPLESNYNRYVKRNNV